MGDGAEQQIQWERDLAPGEWIHVRISVIEGNWNDMNRGGSEGADAGSRKIKNR